MLKCNYPLLRTDTTRCRKSWEESASSDISTPDRELMMTVVSGAGAYLYCFNSPFLSLVSCRPAMRKSPFENNSPDQARILFSSSECLWSIILYRVV